MKMVNVHAAKTQLSRLIDEAESGVDVVIARAGKPIVRLTRIGSGRARGGFGSLKGKIRIAADFDAPLPRSMQRTFGATR
jgi:antitoxin (DNA-binding transcriptional repressor) of toxin-antitoxin stability system